MKERPQQRLLVVKNNLYFLHFEESGPVRVLVAKVFSLFSERG